MDVVYDRKRAWIKQVESVAMGKCVYLRQLNVYSNNNNTSEHVNLHNWLIFVCEIFVMRGSGGGDSWGKRKSLNRKLYEIIFKFAKASPGVDDGFKILYVYTLTNYFHSSRLEKIANTNLINSTPLPMYWHHVSIAQLIEHQLEHRNQHFITQTSFKCTALCCWKCV